MKIRKGFVTNSSSSSFVVTLDKIPESQTELKKMLFEGLEAVGAYSNAFTTETLSGVIFEDIARQSANDWENILAEFLYNSQEFGGVDSWEECARFNFNSREERRQCLDKCDEVNDAAATYRFDAFKTDNLGNYTFILEYGDHDSLGSVLEHGDVFRNVPHIRISKH